MLYGLVRWVSFFSVPCIVHSNFRVHYHEAANPGPYLSQYVRTWCDVSGISLAMLDFLGVTFRNIVCHGNFHKYDDHGPGARH